VDFARALERAARDRRDLASIRNDDIDEHDHHGDAFERLMARLAHGRFVHRCGAESEWSDIFVEWRGRCAYHIAYYDCAEFLGMGSR
jgi:hypothetical protein